MRHAKSSWNNPGMADIARPLNARGRRTAPLIGRYLADHRLFPDRILCSSAQRARETLAGLLPFLPASSETTITGRLYSDPDDTYLPLIHSLAGVAKTVLLIGHNPSIQDTAIAAIGAGDNEKIAAITEKYPTGALAVITFEGDDWKAIEPQSGNLEDFIRPRDLEILEDSNGANR